MGGDFDITGAPSCNRCVFVGGSSLRGQGTVAPLLDCEALFRFIPAVTRLPCGLIVYFAPCGPKDKDAEDLLRFNVTPGASRIRRQKRKLTRRPP